MLCIPCSVEHERVAARIHAGVGAPVPGPHQWEVQPLEGPLLRPQGPAGTGTVFVFIRIT